MNGHRASAVSLLLVTCVPAACSDGDDGERSIVSDTSSSAGGDGGAAGEGGAGSGETTTATGGPGPSGPSGGDGICSPGIACGGIDYCVDFCWSDGCCRLDCWCDADPDTGNLECSLSCT